MGAGRCPAGERPLGGAVRAGWDLTSFGYGTGLGRSLGVRMTTTNRRQRVLAIASTLRVAEITKRQNRRSDGVQPTNGWSLSHVLSPRYVTRTCGGAPIWASRRTTWSLLP